MSLVRLLPAWLHAIADYAVGIALIAVALVIHASGKATAAGIVIGAVILVVSMLTRYPLGVIKVLPFKVHSAADYLAVVLLVAAPFALTFTHTDRALTIVYIAAGVAVLAVSLITNYQYGPAQAQTKAAPAEPGDAGAWYAAAASQRQAGDSAPAPTQSAAEAWRDLAEAAPPARGARRYADAPPAPREAWRDLPGAATPAREAWRDLADTAPTATAVAEAPVAEAPVVEAPVVEVAAPEPAWSAAPDRAGITLEQVLAELAALQRPNEAA